MRGTAGVPYWIFVGVLTIVGIYLSVLYNSPPYFFLAALVLTVFGAWWPGPRYSWVALVGFGGLPAILLSANLLGQVIQADWSCSKISFRPGENYGYGSSSGETVYCSTIPGQLFVAMALFWAISLLGTVALVFLLRRHRPQADSRVAPSGLMGLGVVLLLIVGASASYVVVKAPLTP